MIHTSVPRLPARASARSVASARSAEPESQINLAQCVAHLATR